MTDLGHAAGPPHVAGVDQDKLSLMALKVWAYKQGEMVSLMIHLGDRLGLYQALAGAGPVDAGGLAARTGLDRRWLREWLRGQAAAGLLESSDGETFELTAEAAALLADEDGSVWFAAGTFHGRAAAPEAVEAVVRSFRTGGGFDYDDQGEEVARNIERSLGPWSRLALVPTVLPRLGDVAGRLEAGARVVDVGCGSGTAVLTLAEGFPASRFTGYDPSRYAIERAGENLAARGLTNVTFHRRGAEDLPDSPSFDLALTFDCLHDMPHPRRAAAAIRRCLAPDGTWLIKEIRAGETWPDNLANPVLAMMYAHSVASCLPSGMSAPDGAGLGTLGLPPSRLEAMCRESGFGRVTVHDVGDPANLYYEVRP